MAEAKDQTKQSDEKISDGNLSMTDLKRLIDAGSAKKGTDYSAHLTAAKMMMAIYLSYKEAGFTDEQAFRIVLTLLSSVMSGAKK